MTKLCQPKGCLNRNKLGDTRQSKLEQAQAAVDGWLSVSEGIKGGQVCRTNIKYEKARTAMVATAWELRVANIYHHKFRRSREHDCLRDKQESAQLHEMMPSRMGVAERHRHNLHTTVLYYPDNFSTIFEFLATAIYFYTL